MKTTVNQFIGVIKDTPGYALPNNAFTTADNIRFIDGHAEKFLGHSSFVTPSVAPYFLLPLQRTATFYWIYAGLTAIYSTNGNVHNNMSGTTYAATADDGWTGGIFGGVPILNNGYDNPQALFPVSPTNTFVDLPNWPAATKCAVMKPHKNFLIALDIEKNGARYPYMVKHSNPAVAGSLPTSWDETDPTERSRENELSEEGGYLVDGGSLGDVFIIYRENATYEMRFIGGNNVFSYRKLRGFETSGIYAKNCFTSTPEGHCVLTDDDLIVHNGATRQSILNKRYQNTLFDALSSATNSKRTFLVHNVRKNEVWVCYPTSSDNFATKALIWNYLENTLGERDLPGCRHASFDVVQSQSGTTWTGISGTTWTTVSRKWNTRNYNPSKRQIILADTTNTGLLKGDDTDQFSGVSFTATLQRTGLTLDGDINTVKRITSIRPLISSTGTPAITIKIGYTASPEGSYTWGTGQTFTVGTNYKVDFDNDSNSGRLLGIEFESTGNVNWKLHGFDIEYEIEGKQ